MQVCGLPFWRSAASIMSHDRASRTRNMTVATDWIGAIGTVGTLSTGLVLFAGTVADRRRGYANAVSVWTELQRIDREAFEWKHEDEVGTSIQARIEIENWDDLSGPFDFRLRIKNGGPQPIYGCRVDVRLASVGRPTGAYPVVYES